MRPLFALSVVTLLATAGLAMPARADCYADYKAKRDGGSLQLHYGVAQIPQGACSSSGDVARALAPRLAQDGWVLLNIMSIFGPEGLDARKASAGRYFLRY